MHRRLYILAFFFCKWRKRYALFCLLSSRISSQRRRLFIKQPCLQATSPAKSCMNTKKICFVGIAWNFCVTFIQFYKNSKWGVRAGFSGGASLMQKILNLENLGQHLVVQTCVIVVSWNISYIILRTTDTDHGNIGEQAMTFVDHLRGFSSPW